MKPSFAVLVLVAALGCDAPPATKSEALQAASEACPACSPAAYSDKDGFTVHEWGTMTSVVASDGSLLPGLHHEEEDLPGFVADRVAHERTQPEQVYGKMETPVTYFYSATPLKVRASVAFPSGLMTQWFPWAESNYPWVHHRNGRLVDAWLTTNVSVPSGCDHSEAPFDWANGFLSWGEVSVLAREARPMLAGPVGDSHYRFARNVDSNALQVRDQFEKFLFYRGLGNVDLPVKVTSTSGSTLVLHNTDETFAMGRPVLMNVTAEGAGFEVLPLLASGQSVEASVPCPKMNHKDFVKQLKATLMEQLVGDGLYLDEAKAMVDTWERSYFLTPGVRALYLLPQKHIDAMIPLYLSPEPAVMKRSMVIRLELMTAEYEAGLKAQVAALAVPETKAAARTALLKLGRFAEPHVTRARDLAEREEERAAAEALLTEIRGNRRWAPSTVE